jgi:hypothetical protein
MLWLPNYYIVQIARLSPGVERELAKYGAYQVHKLIVSDLQPDMPPKISFASPQQ